MHNKYAELVNYLKNGGLRITKETKDCIVLNSSSMVWTLDIVGDNLEIRMKGYMPMFGNVSHKWIYQHNYPQSKIILDIENFLDWQLGQFSQTLENNTREHIKF